MKGNSKSVPPLTSLKTPLRDGDLERPDDEAYANSYFVNANSITASITFYAFATKTSRGIACGLQNVQKIRDGEPLGGHSRAEDDFATAADDDFLD